MPTITIHVIGFNKLKLSKLNNFLKLWARCGALYKRLGLTMFTTI